MKLHRYLIPFLVLALASSLAAQTGDAMTLAQLQSLAKDNYPLLKQKQMYSDIGSNKVKQLNSNFLPQINVTGQATYQSEVTEFNFPIPGAPSFAQKPDQYAVGVELKENLT